MNSDIEIDQQTEQQTREAGNGNNSECPDLGIHPLAKLFPEMEGSEYEQFRDDIKANGLSEPITMYQGMVLDGRNRLRACKDLNIQPGTQEWNGNGSILDFVISKNIQRRHLDVSQRAMIASDMKAWSEKEAGESDPLANLRKGPARTLAASALNVSKRSVDSADRVNSKGVPELVAAVRAGEVCVSSAAEVTKLPREEQTAVLAGGKRTVAARAKTIRQEKTKRSKKQGSENRTPIGDSTGLGSEDLNSNERVENAVPSAVSDAEAPATAESLTINKRMDADEIAQKLIDFLGFDDAKQVRSALGAKIYQNEHPQGSSCQPPDVDSNDQENNRLTDESQQAVEAPEEESNAENEDPRPYMVRRDALSDRT